ncbi:MAG: nucleotide exchange factor GrpE [Bdellovibrionales bacterium]|nr:nucleotide exchange factor GrpE [Bdellovibrionales bacterium]
MDSDKDKKLIKLEKKREDLSKKKDEATVIHKKSKDSKENSVKKSKRILNENISHPFSLKKKKDSFKKDFKTDSQEKLRKEKELLSDQLKKSETEFLYLRAEFENYKKRVAEERLNLLRYSGEEFISELATEVLDDLDRALFVSLDQKSVEDLQKGLKMIQKKLAKLFKKFGIEILDPKGKLFDPSYQEALNYIENSNIPEDHVIETYKKAYKFHDKIIRPAQVSVSKKV